jgi:hypothetical protein
MALSFWATALESASAFETSALDPLGWDTARSMESGVIRDSNKLQVFKSVVRLDAISVVHVLTTSQASANMLLHDEIMLKAILAAADVDADVSASKLVAAAGPVAVLASGTSPVGIAALPGTVLVIPSLESRWECLELFSALLATSEHNASATLDRFPSIIA